MPRQLRRDLPEFAVRTVQEEGWGSIRNGELLRRSSERFDVLVTADQRMPKQQNIARFTIGVVVIEAVDTRLPHLRTLLPRLRDAIARVQPGTFIVVKAS